MRFWTRRRPAPEPRPVLTREEVHAFAREAKPHARDPLNLYGYAHYLAAKLALDRLGVPQPVRKIVLELDNNEAHLLRLSAEAARAGPIQRPVSLTPFARDALLTYQNLYVEVLKTLARRAEFGRRLGEGLAETVRAHATFAEAGWKARPGQLQPHVQRAVARHRELRQALLGERHPPFEETRGRINDWLTEWLHDEFGKKPRF
jgi:hypothetical protein